MRVGGLQFSSVQSVNSHNTTKGSSRFCLTDNEAFVGLFVYLTLRNNSSRTNSNHKPKHTNKTKTAETKRRKHENQIVGASQPREENTGNRPRLLQDEVACQQTPANHPTAQPNPVPIRIRGGATGNRQVRQAGNQTRYLHSSIARLPEANWF